MPDLSPILQSDQPINRVWVVYFSRSESGLLFDERWQIDGVGGWFYRPVCNS
jgi:hypothetical protein